MDERSVSVKRPALGVGIFWFGGSKVMENSLFNVRTHIFKKIRVPQFLSEAKKKVPPKAAKFWRPPAGLTGVNIFR